MYLIMPMIDNPYGESIVGLIVQAYLGQSHWLAHLCVLPDCVWTAILLRQFFARVPLSEFMTPCTVCVSQRPVVLT